MKKPLTPATPDSPAPAEPRLAPVSGRRRIMVVDDHPITRLGLINLINSQPDLIVTSEAGDPATAMGRLRQHQPDVLLTDLQMPGRGSLEFIKDLVAFAPALRVLVITMRSESEYAERALRAGACGFLMKSAGGEAILKAIRQVLTGNVAVSAAESARLLQSLSGRTATHSEPAPGVLTDREFEVFQLIGDGADSETIARKLGISRKTVDVYRTGIKRKLQLPSGTALIHHAVHWARAELQATEGAGSDGAAPDGAASM